MVAPVRILGRYALFDQIASGGMATVHLGRLLGSAGFTKTVAIKRMHEQYSKEADFVAMFIDEARLAARVRHPNVVQTMDVVETDGQLFVVMEYIHGLPLSNLIRLARKTGDGIPMPIVSAIVSGALRGLHAAHEATDDHGKPLEIVHRDVSPHNVLVGADGIARVIDFGVAKASGRLQTTQQGQLKGKVPYMSPEQVSGKRVTRQSDVYSASVVLWESLVLRRLFDRENEAAVISGILDSNIDPPSSLSPDVPKAYDEVVLKGLSKNPADRYGTALDMARALEACGRVAAPAEVGEWMERVAPDHLRSRNEQVAEVESTSQLRAVEAIDAQRLLGSAPRIVEQASSSQISSVSVSSTGASPRRGGRWLGAIGVLAVLGGGFAIYYVTRAPRPETPSAPLVTGASSASASTTVVTDAAPAVADVGPDAPASAIAAKSSAKPKLPVPVGAKTQPVAPVATPETKPETPKPAADCDPPYTIDAKGNKQWKMHCL